MYLPRVGGVYDDVHFSFLVSGGLYCRLLVLPQKA